MVRKHDRRMRVDCTECLFTAIAGPSDPELAGEILVRHARETGHKLSLSRFEPADD